MDTSAKEISKDKKVVSSTAEDKVESWDGDTFEELLQTLPKQRNWFGKHLYFYHGFWCPSHVFKAVISFKKQFQALDTDIIITSLPKSGTTWLKALTFSIVNRNKFPKGNNPLLNFNSHQLVRVFEYDLYVDNPSPSLENASLRQPRLFSTHIPYHFLPASIKDSSSKIVYICRNPMDMLISTWFFLDKLRPEDVKALSLDEAFELFCQGIHGFGPYFDHVLGYWKASQENPEKILFLQYEHLKEDIIPNLQKLAMFLGVPFSEEEEQQGVVEEIAKTCSFENLKELDVNKNGIYNFGIPHKTFFRKGEVGDWNNYLTPAMVQHLKNLIKDNFDKSGLTFKLSCKAHKDASA